jgi:hypothetical protein
MQITLDTAAVTGFVGAVTGSLATLAVAWTRVVRPIQRIAEDWNGEPARPRDGVPERPGVMLRLSRIEAEMHPNGGSSMRDAVNRGLAVAERTEANLAAHVAAHGPQVLFSAPPDGTHGDRSGGVAA